MNVFLVQKGVMIAKLQHFKWSITVQNFIFSFFRSFYIYNALVVYLLILSAQFNPVSAITEDDPKYKRDPILKDRIHCLVAVLLVKSTSQMEQNVIGHLRKVLKTQKTCRTHLYWSEFIILNCNFLLSFY